MVALAFDNRTKERERTKKNWEESLDCDKSVSIHSNNGILYDSSGKLSYFQGLTRENDWIIMGNH